MGYPLRWTPPDETGWCPVEVTLRTVGRRLLLRPSPKLTLRINGILARAQKLTGVRVHLPAFPSNHGHQVLSVHGDGDLSRFMQYVAGNIAREVQNLVPEWQGRVWARRYRHSLLTNDEPTLVERFRYVLAQGCVKENLVESPLDWPGPTAVRALYDGSQLVRGEWVDRTALFRARENGQDVTEDDFTTSETLELSPLPCYEHWPAEQYHAWVREMIADIEHEGRVRRRIERKRVLGVAKLLAADPLGTPAPAKRTPAPLFLASCREDRKEWRARYREVLRAFLEASRQLRECCVLDVEFPEFTFPPPRRLRGPPVGARAGPAFAV